MEIRNLLLVIEFGPLVVSGNITGRQGRFVADAYEGHNDPNGTAPGGFDLFRVLRHRFPALPVILMTGLPITSDDVIPRDVTILEKPIGMEKLEQAIADATERKRALS